MRIEWELYGRQYLGINPAGQAATLTLTTGGTWRLFDASLTWQKEGIGNAVIPVSGASYLMLQGYAGSMSTLAVGL